MAVVDSKLAQQKLQKTLLIHLGVESAYRERHDL